MTMFILNTETPFSDGKVVGLWYIGTAIYTVHLYGTCGGMPVCVGSTFIC